MGHVMVPCPEEHVAEFQTAIMFIALGSGSWEDDSLRAFVSDSPAEVVAVLDYVARASIEVGQVTLVDVERNVGVPMSDLLDLMFEANRRCVTSGRAAFFVISAMDLDGRAVPATFIPVKVARLYLRTFATEGSQGAG